MEIELSNKITMVKIKTEHVILNEDSGRYLKTNHHGATIINLIENKTTFTELKLKFINIFSINEDLAEKDLKAFLSEAQKLGIVKLID